jgi:succinate dehydrogenase/fumarate reductase-like Fe-S protein
VLRGYRGFVRELSHTGGARALSLQLRTGAAHLLRRLRGARAADPIAIFFRNYGADGFRLPDADRAQLQLAAEACLVCGLCSAECARAGGVPLLEPRDAVIAAARLEIDWLRLGLSEPIATPCAACRACNAVCPAGIPIDRIQESLARLGREAAAPQVATPAEIR